MKISLLIVIAFATSSCVLPIPHKRLHGPGVSAVIIDAHQKAPIAGATVAPTDDASVLEVSDSKGHFTIPPRYGWHGAAVLGPVGSSLFPSLDVTPSTREVIVSAKGYHERKVTFKARYSGNEWTECTSIELIRRP